MPTNPKPATPTPPEMSTSIHILKDGVQFYLTEDEVRERLAKKRFSLSDKASCAGGRDWWIPLAEVLAFLDAQRSAPSSKPHEEQQQRLVEPQRTQSLDYYAVLGVRRGASQEEVKAAYRLRMQEYHPDKVAHLGPDLRVLAERKAKEINEAYQALLSLTINA